VKVINKTVDWRLVFKNFTRMDNETGNSLISFGEFVRAMWAVQGSQSEARD
jgi:hypothetical protein